MGEDVNVKPKLTHRDNVKLTHPWVEVRYPIPCVGDVFEMGGNGVKGSTFDSCLLCYKNGLCPGHWEYNI